MHSGFNILKAYFCSYMNDRRSCDRMVVGFGVVEHYSIVVLILAYMNSFLGGVFMVLSATFNNISVISQRSVLLVEKNGGPGENHRPCRKSLIPNYIASGCY
jgi:hypothetical protein